MPRGRGRPLRLRHSGRGDARSQRGARRLGYRVRPGAARAGRCVHGRHVRAADALGRRLPRHARAGRHEPRDRRRRRVPGPLADGRAHRPGRPRADAQGVASVHRRRLDAAADHQVQHAAELLSCDPGGRAQGVQGRRGAEAGPDPHRAARGRDGRAGRRGAAPHPARSPPARAERRRAARGDRRHLRRRAPDRAGGQRRRSHRLGRRAARVRRDDRHRRRRDVHGQGDARLRGSANALGPSACSRATTRSLGSTTPTS